MQDAVADCRYAIGWTRRAGMARTVHPSWPALCARHPDVAAAASSSERVPESPVAFVFGREESGLNMQELAACTHLCAILTGRVQASMNLSHAVAVTLAPVFQAAVGSLDGAGVLADAGALLRAAHMLV